MVMTTMLLLIDNYDSFTYNLVHYLGELGADVRVVRNDAMDVQAAMALKPEAIVLSPGPCDPDQAGICLPLTLAAAETKSDRSSPEATLRLVKRNDKSSCFASIIDGRSFKSLPTIPCKARNIDINSYLPRRRRTIRGKV
jgi:hypothetical protein